MVAKKKRILGIAVIALLVVAAASAFVGGPEAETEEETPRFVWPKSGICQLLPQPEAEFAELYWSDEESFSMLVYEYEADQYQSYVEACQDAGFTAEAYQSSDSYSAENEDGCSLSLYYWPDERQLDISLSAPIGREVGAQSDKEVVKKDDGAKKNEGTKKSKSAKSDNQSALADLVTPEFKETMDSYEAFFDEYIEFMQKYEDSDDAASMMLDMAEYMEKYADLMDKMAQIEDSELSEADAWYYAEVSARIYAKLAEAGL